MKQLLKSFSQTYLFNQGRKKMIPSSQVRRKIIFVQVRIDIASPDDRRESISNWKGERCWNIWTTCELFKKTILKLLLKTNLSQVKVSM